MRAAITYAYTSTAFPNQLAGVSGPTGTVGYGYDANGNTAAITTTSTLTSTVVDQYPTYDGDGRLIAVSDNSGHLVVQSYNGLGQRTWYRYYLNAQQPAPTYSLHFQYRGGQLAQVAVSGAAPECNRNDTRAARRRSSTGRTGRRWSCSTPPRARG